MQHIEILPAVVLSVSQTAVNVSAMCEGVVHKKKNPKNSHKHLSVALKVEI